MRRLERLLAIALFLGNRRRVLARDVAEQFEISLRTVYRDMRALQEAGFPLEGTAGDGYRLSQASFLRPLSLTPDEAEALTLAAHALSASATPSLHEPLSRATAKLEASLDDATRRRVLELQRRIAVPEFVRRTSGPTGEVLQAIRARHAVEIVYSDPRSAKQSRRVVEPLGLVCVGKAWWLVAYCALRRDARAFRIDHIEKWSPTGETFKARRGLSFSEIIARDGHLARRLFGS